MLVLVMRYRLKTMSHGNQQTNPFYPHAHVESGVAQSQIMLSRLVSVRRSTAMQTRPATSSANVRLQCATLPGMWIALAFTHVAVLYRCPIPSSKNGG